MLPDLFKKVRYISTAVPQPHHEHAPTNVKKSTDRLSAPERISLICDSETFSEIDSNMRPVNHLNFDGYSEKINSLRQKTGLNDAIITGNGRIGGIPALIAAMDHRFMMGSMGSVVGEKLTRLFELGAEKHLPVVIFTTSGGARMQEGIISLMQMAKVSAAVKKHHDQGQLYITVLTDPTTGGVTASYAMLGDIILAEPNALIGFAGPRVIEGTIHAKLPEGFQRAEFQLQQGFVDSIVPREQLKDTIAKLLLWHKARGHAI